MQDGSTKLDIGERLTRLLRSDLNALHVLCSHLGLTPDELRAQAENVDALPLLTLLRVCEVYDVSVDHVLGLGFDADAMSDAVFDVFKVADNDLGPIANALNEDLQAVWAAKCSGFVTRALMDRYLNSIDSISADDTPDRVSGRYDPWAEPAALQPSDVPPKDTNSERAEAALH